MNIIDQVKFLKYDANLPKIFEEMASKYGIYQNQRLPSQQESACIAIILAVSDVKDNLAPASQNNIYLTAYNLAKQV